jgi:hypothetical protein
VLKIRLFLTITTLLFPLNVYMSRAEASTIPFQFTGDLQTGVFAGTLFAGTASFDSTGVTGIGTEYFSLTSLNFNVAGTPFTLADISQGGQVILEDNIISYFTAAFFPTPSPFTSFAFGFGGPGVIGYAVGPDFGARVYTIQPVAEPATLTLFGIACSALSLIYRLRRQS